MTTRFFFPPLGALLEMAGGPKDDLAALLKWNAKLFGFKIKMDRKTLKRALATDQHTPQTEEKLAEMRDEMLLRAGASSQLCEDIESSNGDAWEALVCGLNEGCPADFLPRSRALLGQRLAEDAELVHEVRRYGNGPRTVVSLLLQNPLTERLNQEIEIDSVELDAALRAQPDAKAVEEFLRNHKRFMHWRWHCTVSLLMEILACADVELCENEVPEDYPRPPDFAGIVLPLLPRIAGSKVIPPIRRLFERWRAVLGYRSWGEFVENDPDELRTLRRWIDDEEFPSWSKMNELLERLFRDKRQRQMALPEYAIARLLAKLFKKVESELPGVSAIERVRMFDTYARHRMHFYPSGGQIPDRT